LRPGDALLVVGRVDPTRHHAEVEGRVAEAERGARRLNLLGRAVERLDQDSTGRAAEHGHSAQQIVDQLRLR
jgi:hypothetical protein